MQEFRYVFHPYFPFYGVECTKNVLIYTEYCSIFLNHLIPLNYSNGAVPFYATEKKLLCHGTVMTNPGELHKKGCEGFVAFVAIALMLMNLKLVYVLGRQSENNLILE